ncbi:ABC transporter permease [Actinomadura nitritigenes]|uniref:ABC transporter permease n=1 Tax=Actinomadura nitritigenes TaxID=134602 RepID=UPI003D8E0BBC
MLTRNAQLKGPAPGGDSETSGTRTERGTAPRSRVRAPALRKVALRALHLVVVVFLVTLLASALVDLIPGSPGSAILGPTASADQIARFDHEHGFDRPLLVRYGHWVAGALHGDLGTSLANGQPVLDTIVQRVPVTLELALLAILLSVAVAVPLGVYTAARAGGILDRILTGISSFFMSIPNFIAGLVLVYLLAITFRAFPVTGWAPLSDGISANLSYVFLPVLALALAELPAYHRVLRADMISTLRTDFVQIAHAKGLPKTYVLFRHALRPSAFSLLTMAGVSFGRLLGGSIVIEMIFALPGLGNLAVQSIPAKDIPTIQGLVAVVAVGYVLVNMAMDLCYALLDPRLRGR